MTRIVTSHYRYKRRLAGIFGLVSLTAAGPTPGADTFDGTYTGNRVLMKGPRQQCVLSEDVSATIHGGVLMFTNGALHNFSIGFDPHPDGSFSEISTVGASVLIQGRIVRDVLDADVTNGPCEHHWHLTKKR